jgi:hypothetical protein
MKPAAGTRAAKAALRLLPALWAACMAVSPAAPTQASPTPAPYPPGPPSVLPPQKEKRPVASFDPGKASFSLSYKDETSPYRVNAAFVLPGETLELAVEDPRGEAFTLSEGASGIPASGRAKWAWIAPRDPGRHALVVRKSGGDSVAMNVFVMVPASQAEDGYLGSYRIGKYPLRPLKAIEFYRNPRGFVRVDSAAAATPVSPHFTLGQFLCKQSQGFPSYLVLRERLVLKLEAVLEEVNRQGYPAQGFHVMSGFRTPYYNKRIGNVKHSAHQWGGAADVFIDENPADGMMDDLNGDGRSDGEDSRILFRIVDRMSLSRYYLPYLGGIGHYSRNRSHGPFVHVDVRGFRAIW